MGHIGLTPQSATKLGGFRAQGRTAEAARKLVEDALALEAAGCFAIVLEAVPAPVAARDHRGARDPDDRHRRRRGVRRPGARLARPARPLRGPHAALRQAVRGARRRDRGARSRRYVADVRSGRFPEEQHTYSIPDEELARLRGALRRGPAMRRRPVQATSAGPGTPPRRRTCSAPRPPLLVAAPAGPRPGGRDSADDDDSPADAATATAESSHAQTEAAKTRVDRADEHERERGRTPPRTRGRLRRCTPSSAASASGTISPTQDAATSKDEIAQQVGTAAAACQRSATSSATRRSRPSPSTSRRPAVDASRARRESGEQHDRELRTSRRAARPLTASPIGGSASDQHGRRSLARTRRASSRAASTGVRRARNGRPRTARCARTTRAASSTSGTAAKPTICRARPTWRVGAGRASRRRTRAKPHAGT